MFPLFYSFLSISEIPIFFLSRSHLSPSLSVSLSLLLFSISISFSVPLVMVRNRGFPCFCHSLFHPHPTWTQAVGIERGWLVAQGCQTPTHATTKLPLKGDPAMAAGLVVFRFRGELHSLLPSRSPWQPLRSRPGWEGAPLKWNWVGRSEEPAPRLEHARTKRDGGVESSGVRRGETDEGGWKRGRSNSGGKERKRDSISLGNSNLHLFYYIIIPTRRSISGALKRWFSNRFAWNFYTVNFVA